MSGAYYDPTNEKPRILFDDIPDMTHSRHDRMGSHQPVKLADGPTIRTVRELNERMLRSIALGNVLGSLPSYSEIQNDVRRLYKLHPPKVSLLRHANIKQELELLLTLIDSTGLTLGQLMMLRRYFTKKQFKHIIKLIKENKVMLDNSDTANDPREAAADPPSDHLTPGGQPGDNPPEPAATETTVETPGGTTVTETTDPSGDSEE